MVTLPASGYISETTRTVGERKQFLEDLRQFLEDRLGIDSGILARSQNALINGNFDFWQRGTTVTTTSGGAYLADRFRHELVGAGGSITVSRQAFTLGQTDVPGEPEYYYRANLTAAPATLSRPLEQRIEGVRSFAGQTVTVSLWVKADAAQTFDCVFVQDFGTGGSPSGAVTLTQNFSLTTGWQKIVLTYDLASISGKTIGTNGDDYLGLRIDSNVGTLSTYTLDMAQVQVEPGDGATPFDARRLDEEYRLAARYFIKSYRPGTDPGTLTGAGAWRYRAPNAGAVNFAIGSVFPVQMRDQPTITLYNPSAANSNWRNLDGPADSGAANVLSVNEQALWLANPQVGGDALSDRMLIHWTADAEL